MLTCLPSPYVSFTTTLSASSSCWIFACTLRSLVYKCTAYAVGNTGDGWYRPVGMHTCMSTISCFEISAVSLLIASGFSSKGSLGPDTCGNSQAVSFDASQMAYQAVWGMEGGGQADDPKTQRA